MRLVKLGICEGIAALTLLGVAHVHLVFRQEPGILNPSMLTGVFVALYVAAAIASEALIASTFRPATGWLVVFNVVVAGIITQPGWTHENLLKIFVAIALGTAILRVLVGAISLRRSRTGVFRFTSALVGGALLITSGWGGLNLFKQTYYTYYLFPRFKEGYAAPTRWQDFVAFAGLWGAVVLIVYLSYRLLKYALDNRNLHHLA